jgi:hypothetical protein
MPPNTLENRDFYKEQELAKKVSKKIKKGVDILPEKE